MKRRKICLIIISGIIFGAAAAVAAKAVFERAAGPDIVIEEPAYTDMEMGIASVIFGIALLVVLGIILVILIPICFFLLNPLLVGGKRFFYQNIREDAQVKEICFSFDNHYMNSVKILFFRDLYTILWSLLFIIPGIVKGYREKGFIFKCLSI